jgi:hypothetical protein
MLIAMSTASYLPTQTLTYLALACVFTVFAWLLTTIVWPQISRRYHVMFFVFLLIAVGRLFTIAHYKPPYRIPSQKVDPVKARPISVLFSPRSQRMDELWATVVSDVLPGEEQSEWCWTNQHPRLRFLLDESGGWTFYIRFAAVEKVLTTIGPQTIQIAVNGTSINRTIAKHGDAYELHIKIDPRLIKPGTLNNVQIDINPVYVATDGVRLGVLLHSVGFIKVNQ